MKTNNFNSVAFYYDTLVKIVFGSAMTRAQTFYLNAIQPRSRVLIIGGGTGWILQSLPADTEVWYVDFSSEMITLAKKKIVKCNVHFIEGTEEAIPNQQYDVVITNFYLDLFTFEKASAIVEKVKAFTSSKSIWIVTDFVKHKWWQRLLLAIMFLFFRIASNIESRMLLDWETVLRQAEFVESESNYFYSGFIKTVLFKAR